jgi:hypothetical protein
MSRITQMTIRKTIAALLLLTIAQTTSAQYEGWRHSGSLTILTTPEGADLPATVVERDFPLQTCCPKAQESKFLLVISNV